MQELWARVRRMSGRNMKDAMEEDVHWDFSNTLGDGVRLLDIYGHKSTGSKKFVDVHIVRDTLKQCYEELDGQYTDGYFENSEKDIEVCLFENGCPDWYKNKLDNNN